MLLYVIYPLGRRRILLSDVQHDLSNVLAIFYPGMRVASAFKWKHAVDMRPNPSGVDAVKQ
jgi:hypothetical protein